MSQRLSTQSKRNASPIQNGLLADVLVIQTGIAKGHGFRVDDRFLADLVSFAQGKEFKVYYGHQDDFWDDDDPLDDIIGLIKEFRLAADGQSVIANVQLIDSAKINPEGNLYEYVLSLVQSIPHLIGFSIVFSAKGMIDGTPESPYSVPIFGELSSVDLVAEPAATNRVFFSEKNQSPHTFSQAPHLPIMEHKLSVPPIVAKFISFFSSDKLEVDANGAVLIPKTELEAVYRTLDDLRKNQSSEALSAKEAEIVRLQANLSQKDAELQALKTKHSELEAQFAAFDLTPPAGVGHSKPQKATTELPALQAEQAQKFEALRKNAAFASIKDEDLKLMIAQKII